ncbi:MAG: hypothetical protein KDG54_15175 [Geminicoccaceae bacterium]|nr:hypothetical protein [Geminicoccaceae bacterium]
MAEFIDEPSRTRANKQKDPFGVDVDVIALIGLTQSMNSAMREETLTKTTQACGALIEHEAKGASQKAYDPKLHRQMLDRNRTMPWAMKRKAIQAINSGNGWTWERWDLKKKTTLGSHAISGALATGLFDIEKKSVGEKTDTTLLVFSEQGLRIISTSNLMSHLKLTRLPMVTEPSQWAVSDFDAAPYITTVANDGVAFNRKGSQAQRRVYPTWGNVVKVGNHLSQVQFKVDRTVVEATEFANDNAFALPKFPARIPERYPFPEDYEERPDEERKAIRKEAGARRKAIYQATVDQAKLENELSWLRRLGEYPAIWLPHSADWRGRLYPIGDLQFQREDRVRAAFRFAEGAPLGDDGLDWLAFHVANSASGDEHGKLDKLPIAERMAWGYRQLDLCRTLHRDWQGRPELWTQGIDKPFAFLQAAIEFAMGHEGGRTFVSTVPVGFDGTNSGLQHFSAIMRAEDEGALVNLTASDKPQDVYATVAREVEQLIGQWVSSPEAVTGAWKAEDVPAVLDACSQWINHGIDRSTVKRQVMTFVYSAQEIGFGDQIRTDIMAPLMAKVGLGQLDKHPFGEDNGFFAARVLARAIWQSLQSVIRFGSAAMEWLRTAAGVMANANMNMSWSTPLGANVVQETWKRGKEKRIELFMSSDRYTVPTTRGRNRVTVHGETKYVNKRSAMNGISPNYIHSRDACHLQMTVLACRDAGIKDFLMIHDQFSVPAGQATALNRILREQFVKMNEGHPLEDLRIHCQERLDAKGSTDVIPPVPAQGTLDLKGVLESPYFFS